MTDTVAVSVIMSTRNRAAYLPDVLRTLAAQQGRVAFEVIVVDNGSTDGTAALLEDWCRRDPKFRTTCEPVPGLSRGKNAGIEAARAPLLLFTDDDVQVDPHWVRTFHDLFAERQDPMMIAGGSIIPIPQDLGPWPAWFDEAALPDVGMLPHREERLLEPREYVWGANMAVPARLFAQVGGWEVAAGLRGDERVTGLESRFFEDTELQDRVRQAGGRVWFCPRAIVRHRVERRSVTPQRIVETAFARGRAEFWTREIRIWKEMRLVPKQSAVGKCLGLATNLLLWSVWLVLFRVTRSKGPLEHARQAAHATGQQLDGLLAGRGGVSRWVFDVIGRTALLMRTVLVRLTPATP